MMRSDDAWRKMRAAIALAKQVTEQPTNQPTNSPTNQPTEALS